MTAGELTEVLKDLLRAITEDEEGDETELRGAELASLRRADSLTSDAGFVITLSDGAEFRVTIIQSKIGDHGEDEGEEDDSTP